MPSRFGFAILAAALSISPAAAQARGTGMATAGFGISIGPPASGTTMGGAARFPGHAPGRGTVLFSYPYFYSDSDYNAREVSQQSPQVIVVSAVPASPPEPPLARQSVLIELQGDRFVRTTMSDGGTPEAQAARGDSEKSVAPFSASGQSRSKQTNVAEPARKLLPAVLVFRDGRREEVSEYTIVDGTIYSKADYWTTGSWTRKVAIADLDVPATLKLNQERGSRFMLPASPNEVMVRP